MRVPNEVCVWLHGESLSERDPALLANPAAPAIFVFDEPLLQKLQPSFKRLMFMFECVEEALANRAAPTAIFRGDVVACVTAFARDHDCVAVHTTSSEVPGFHVHAANLRPHILVELHDPPQFVGVVTYQPRFARFWRLVERDAFTPTSNQVRR